MGKDGHASVVTPGRLRQLENPRNLLKHKERPMICMKDVIPSPKRVTRLNLTLKSSRTVKTSQRSKRIELGNGCLPSFLFDFLDEERPQLARPPRDPINLFDPISFKLRQKRQHLSQVTPTIYIESEDKFPELHIQKLGDRKECRTSNDRKHSLDPKAFYKPYVIEITPRSSVTLYGVEPISLPLASHHNMPKKHKNFATSINMRNISTEKYKKLDTSVQPVIISSPAKSFAEKLQRVQDIAKEAEDSFNIF